MKVYIPASVMLAGLATLLLIGFLILWSKLKNKRGDKVMLTASMVLLWWALFDIANKVSAWLQS